MELRIRQSAYEEALRIVEAYEEQEAKDAVKNCKYKLEPRKKT